MDYSFKDTMSLAALVLWPVIPLFWVPVHGLHAFFRRLGFLTYVLPLVTWAPIAAVLFAQRDILLRYRLSLPFLLEDIGLVVFILGLSLQLWTLLLLSGPVIMGMPEVARVPGKIVTAGPFSMIRHPTYLSHTMMLAGLFFWTGVVAVGVTAVLDAAVSNAVIIPLEERELRARFGAAYDRYREQVPCRILPFCKAAPRRQ